MQRAQFEHVIAAAANVVGEDEFVVIGSQAIFGAVVNPPEEMLQSMEADLYPVRSPERADDVEGAMGDGSPFQQSFGFFAHGVGPETAKAPRGWESRLVRVEIPPRATSPRRPVALCLEAHDLVLAKLVRGAQRDWDYARVAIEAGIVEPAELQRRCTDLPIERSRIDHIARQLRALSS